MIRRTLLILRVVAVLVAMVLATALPAFADRNTDPGREDPGQPADADCWGEVTSEVASPIFGQHASNPDPSDEDPDTPREGVGNVAMQPFEEGGDDAPGEHVSDHGAEVGPGFGASCEPGPGGGAGK